MASINKKPKLAIIIPSFNEEENIETTFIKVTDYLQNLVKENLIHKSSFITFVDDGSSDTSKEILKKLKKKYANLKCVFLSKNYGHQIALIAGLDESVHLVDVMVSIDCDLQQELNAIGRFLVSYKKGNNIVLGVRRDRSKDHFLKFLSANIYHSLVTSLGIKYVKGHSDFRLVESKAYLELQKFIWANQFLRSVFSNTNFKTSLELHDVEDRKFGASKYSIKKMFALAFEGIFTNSFLTLRAFGYLGLSISFLSILLVLYGLVIKIFFEPVAGFTTLLLVISFFGGAIMFSLSLLSECILRLLKQFLGDSPYKLEEKISDKI